MFWLKLQTGLISPRTRTFSSTGSTNRRSLQRKVCAQHWRTFTGFTKRESLRRIFLAVSTSLIPMSWTSSPRTFATRLPLVSCAGWSRPSTNAAHSRSCQTTAEFPWAAFSSPRVVARTLSIAVSTMTSMLKVTSRFGSTTGTSSLHSTICSRTKMQSSRCKKMRLLPLKHSLIMLEDCWRKSKFFGRNMAWMER